MRKVAADANPLLKRSYSRPDRTGLSVIELQVAMHVVDHGFDARVARSVATKGAPGKAAEEIGLAVPAPKQELQSVGRELRDRVLCSTCILDVPRAVVANDPLGGDLHAASGRDEPGTPVAEHIVIAADVYAGAHNDPVRRLEISSAGRVYVKKRDHRRRSAELERSFEPTLSLMTTLPVQVNE